LIKNKIVPILFNNTVTGKNVSLVVKKIRTEQSFKCNSRRDIWSCKENQYCYFGHGLVGGTLINQILESATMIEKRKDIKLNVLRLPILEMSFE
jgi:aspartokinase/homoserine dehydrogenase 1